MHSSSWDDLRYFLAADRLGSLSAAARALGVNHSTVFRRLAALEGRLGVRLFERGQNGYVATSAGEELRLGATNVEGEIDRLGRALAGRDFRLSGTVRVTSTDTMVLGLLTPHFAAFRRLHPGIQLQVVISNSVFNLNKREADVAIRPTNSPPENLVGRRLGRVGFAVYGGTKYLRQAGAHTTLADHDWIAPDESLSHLAQSQWIAKNIPEARVVYRVDSLVAMVQAARAGIGVALLLRHLADSDRSLRMLSGAMPSFDTQVWLLTHPDLRHAARIKAFMDFMQDRLESERAFARASRG
jgi:DNA-binding transcriptional LysR family regulator